jgi:SAM-dependent methyltransferase
VTEWLAFWNRPNRIFVNECHRRLHFARIADDILALLPKPGMNVLDYGCGEALDAARVADRCARLWLCEDAATVRARLARRFADHPVVRVTDGRGVGSLAPNTLDVVIVNSVVQYLPAAEFDRLLHLWYDRLKPDGLLVLGDIVPPSNGLARDALSLLRLARREGFLLPAISNLIATRFSTYARLRNKYGLSSYSKVEMIARLRACGFHAEQCPNLGFNSGRMAFLARPAPRKSP